MDPPDTSIQKSRADAAARRVRAIASGLVVDIGDLPVLLRADGPERADALERALGGSPPATEPAAATILLRDGPILVPSHDPGEAYGDMEIWRLGDELFAHRRGGLSASATPSAITIGGTSSDLAAATRQILQPTLTHLLAHSGRYVLHAGALLIDERALLAFGPTGAGKSTLLAVALHRGMPVLGDDLVMVRAGSDGLEACGIAKQLALPGDVAVPEGATPLLDARGRVALSADHLRPGWFPIAGSVLIGHGSNEAGVLKPAAGLDAFEDVLRSFLSAPDPALLRSFHPVAASLVRLPVWWFEHALPHERREDAAAALLEEIRRRLAG
jgi:hypothetical protein